MPPNAAYLHLVGELLILVLGNCPRNVHLIEVSIQKLCLHYTITDVYGVILSFHVTSYHLSTMNRCLMIWG